MLLQFFLMTRVFLFYCFTSLFLTPCYSQDYSIDRPLPDFEELPKSGEVKTLYEFELNTNYKLFNANGELLKEGYSKFVDMTEYPAGKYLFRFDGQEVIYQIPQNKKDTAKHFYEFDKVYDYKLYNLTGDLLEKGSKKMVDMTNYPPGVYFFHYNGIKVPYKLDPR